MSFDNVTFVFAIPSEYIRKEFKTLKRALLYIFVCQNRKQDSQKQKTNKQTKRRIKIKIEIQKISNGTKNKCCKNKNWQKIQLAT